jgi:hypothetical protein
VKKQPAACAWFHSKIFKIEFRNSNLAIPRPPHPSTS